MASFKEFNVVIEQDSDGYFVASVPELRGCHTQAKSLETLMKRVREVIQLCLEDQEVGFIPSTFVGVQRIRIWYAAFAKTQGQGTDQILKDHGFELVRTRGSHHSMRHSDGRYTVVPVHAGETIGVGLLLKILKDAELSKDNFKQ